MTRLNHCVERKVFAFIVLFLASLSSGCIVPAEPGVRQLKTGVWTVGLKADVVSVFAERLPERFPHVAVNDANEGEIRFLLGNGDVKIVAMKNLRRVSSGWSYREVTSGEYVSVLRFGDLIEDSGFVQEAVELERRQVSRRRERGDVSASDLERVTAIGVFYDEGNHASFHAFLDGIPGHRRVVGIVMTAIE